jgi:coenzyme F420-reducing hydrogenase gamma subunit
MITQQEAEKRSRQLMMDYVNSCECQTNEDVANVLMKLISVCGVGMCAVVGNVDAVARMQSTTDFVKNSMADVRWKQEKAN